MEEFVYKKGMVYHTLENWSALEDNWSLPPDHELRFVMWDIDRVLKKLELTTERKKLVILWKQGFDVEHIAKELGTYERKIYREKWNIAQNILNDLNGEEIK